VDALGGPGRAQVAIGGTALLRGLDQRPGRRRTRDFSHDRGSRLGLCPRLAPRRGPRLLILRIFSWCFSSAFFVLEGRGDWSIARLEEDLFNRAMEKRTLAEHFAFSDHACADQPEVREGVERLLRSRRHEDRFLQAGTTADQPIAECPGTVIGPYKLIEQIGEGGMGTVWMAQQTETLKRVVAVKLIKAGEDFKQGVARFDARRHAPARIAPTN